MVSQKFIQRIRTMGAAELVFKSPSVPLFQRGNFLPRTLTPLCKRGEGEILKPDGVENVWRIPGTGH